MSPVPDDSFCLSNFKLEVTCEGRPQFERAMRIAFGQFDGAVAWSKPEANEMKLYWCTPSRRPDDSPSGAHDLPFKMDASAAIDFVWSWMQTVDKKDLESPDDFDGSASPSAWTVSADAMLDDYVMVSVRKEWAIYGK